MSTIDLKLDQGEQVLFRTKRSKKWYEIVQIFIIFVILLPILFWVFIFLMLPILDALLPEPLGIVMTGGFLALISISLFLNLIHFFSDEFVLTSQRILGQAMGRTVFNFRKIAIPLSEIESVSVASSRLKIQRKDGSDLILSSLGGGREFAARVKESLHQQG